MRLRVSCYFRFFFHACARNIVHATKCGVSKLVCVFLLSFPFFFFLFFFVRAFGKFTRAYALTARGFARVCVSQSAIFHCLERVSWFSSLLLHFFVIHLSVNWFDFFSFFPFLVFLSNSRMVQRIVGSRRVPAWTSHTRRSRSTFVLECDTWHVMWK